MLFVLKYLQKQPIVAKKKNEEFQHVSFSFKIINLCFMLNLNDFLIF